MTILTERGGIMMDRELLLTEDLSWLDNIDSNPYVNRGSSLFSSEVVGFYDPRLSLAKVIKTASNFS